MHTLSKTIQAFYDLGSINHLLPIIELITKEKNFCTGKIFDKYIDIIIYIFSNLSDYFKLFDKNAPFFFYLSYFLEKIEDKNGEIFNKELCNKLIELNNTFIKNKDNNNYKLFIKNFNEHIFLNEKIIFKFNYELQKEIINEITNSIMKFLLLNVLKYYYIMIRIKIINIVVKNMPNILTMILKNQSKYPNLN